MYNDDEGREHEQQGESKRSEGPTSHEVDLPPSFFASADDVDRPAGGETSTAPNGGTAPVPEEPLIEGPETPRDRLLAFVKNFRERVQGKPQNPGGTLTSKSRIAQDRTKVTLAIAGACLVAIVIFLVTFTRPATPHRTQDQRAHPNLGRPENSENKEGRSGVPLRSAASVKPGDRDGRISDQDILNTSKFKPRAPHAAAPAAQTQKDYAVNKILFPAEGAPVTAPLAPPTPQAEKYQPSLVFVRSASTERGAVSAQPVSAAYAPVVMSSFFSALPPGTRLVARLESPVSTALKNTPAAAAIEYNYSRDGEIVIPAGSKAFGKLSSANEHGMVELAFDTIELPDGTTQKIDAFGESLTYQPIKGSVTGRNIGLQFLVQSLTGVGSIAAATVGTRSGAGINDSLSNNSILRERLSENIATAGQNQMSSLAYRQNIVVTVPGNTRFYLVLGRNEKGREGMQSTPAERPIPPAAPSSPSAENASLQAQYLQELKGMKQQLDQLSRQQSATDPSGQQEQPVAPPPQ